MTVTVRPAELDTEREALLAVLERNLPDLAHRRRFDWLYRANPAGHAWAWLACDSRTKEVIGTASVFPRAVWLGNRQHRCGQVGDFAIDAGHRSLGPAVLLQRATFAPVDDGSVAFCYDCPPHEQGMATFRRLRIDAACQTRRYARLLRAERQVEKRVGRSLVAGAVASLANAALAMRSARTRSESGLEIGEHVGRFGDEFSALDLTVGGPGVLRSRRSANDLNWRFRDDPLHEYGVLAARRHGELVAFLVFSWTGGDGLVVDLGGHLSGGVTVALLDAAAQFMRRRGVQTLRTTVGDGQRVREALRRAGFRLREPGPQVVVHGRPDVETARFFEHTSNWWIRQIDLLA
jgi:hypothetical protein